MVLLLKDGIFRSYHFKAGVAHKDLITRGASSMSSVTRRRFIERAVYGAGTVVMSAGCVSPLTACSGEGIVAGSFDHGVASGDPLHDRVILWTRATPQDPAEPFIRVFWEVSVDPELNGIIRSGSDLARSENDYTFKVDAVGLKPGKQYYYRFSTISNQSRIGKTKTLPKGNASNVKLLAMSCATYPAGFFHVYAEAAKQQNVDAALHLGDYIYEHGRGGYASEDAEALGRQVLPEGEIITLEDYRVRYAQYREDRDLQEFHASIPVIAIWDDHEIANDAWREGAENHNEESEGEYVDRLFAALKAYYEWMPIRPRVDHDVGSLYRSFQFGELVNLVMLDTRIVGRDLPLNITDYVNADGTFDNERYSSDVNDPDRTILGTKQREWLKKQMASPSKWTLLGQQVLMGEMNLPGAIATLQLSVSQYAELATAAHIAATDPGALSEEQSELLALKGHLLSLPTLPYNLDAWDGYPAERRTILDYAASHYANLVVLAGDTHNAWANNLKQDSNALGVEFATASVTSPGIEAFFGLDTTEEIVSTEAAVLKLIENVKYTNLANRGFLTVTFTTEDVTAKWTFVSSIKEKEYEVLEGRGNEISVGLDKMEIS